MYRNYKFKKIKKNFDFFEHNQKKLRIPNIANNDTEENISNLIRPTPKKIPEINKSQNYLQKTNPFKSFENKTNISEGSSSFSK